MKHDRQISFTPLITVLFFLSGACALAYEVAWTRMLVLAAGGCTHALTSVLAAYMGGLALGSWTGGRLADRFDRPGLLYGLLEGGIAVTAVAATLLIPLLPLLLHAGTSVLGQGWPFIIFRFLVCAGLLVVPTALMGATFPVILRAFSFLGVNIGRSAGILYAANTAGAMAGAIISGFAIIPALGYHGAVYAAAVGNLLVMAAVLAVPGLRSEPGEGSVVTTPAYPAAFGPGRGFRLLAAGYAVSGFAAMLYQVGWSRAIALSIGTTTYAVSIILAAFIGGLMLGGLIITPIIDRLRRPMLAAAGLEAAIGLSALAIMPAFSLLACKMYDWSGLTQGDFAAALGLRFGSAFALVLVPTAAMGALMPVAVALATRLRPGVAAPAGAIYAANTAGSILGAVASGFFLLDLVGIERALWIATFLNLLVAAAWFLGSEASRLRAAFAGGGLLLAGASGVWLLPHWDQAVMNSGPYLYADRLRQKLGPGVDTRRAITQNIRVLFYADGPEATVTVQELKESGARNLTINGKVDASTTSDMSTQVLSAHLPLLLHGRPRTAMILGLASGITAGSAQLWGLDDLDCVEISPEVVAASRYFAAENRLDYDDPRFHLMITDARNYLALSDVRYDVIILEPTNPWVSGMSMLFTREFYALLRSRLNDGGLAAAWVPAYNMDRESVQLILRSFLSAFPEASMWELIPGGDYLLVGSTRPLSVTVSGLDRLASGPRLAEDLRRVGVRSGRDLLARFLMGPDRLREVAGPGPLHVDDRLQLEFSAPRLMCRPESARMPGIVNDIILRHQPATVIAPDLPASDADSFLRRRESFFTALLASMTGADGGVGGAVGRWRAAMAEAEGGYPSAFAASNLSRLLLLVGDALAQAGRNDEAVAAWSESFELGASSSAPTRRLIEYHQSRRQPDLARRWAERSLSRFPHDPLALHVLGEAALEAGDLSRAEPLLRRAVAAQPENLQARIQLGLTLALAGRMAEAELETRAALELDPERVETLVILAHLAGDQGRKEESEKLLARARRLAPDHPALR